MINIGLDQSQFERPYDDGGAFEPLPVPQTPWESFTGGISDFFTALGMGSQGHRGQTQPPRAEASPAGGSGGFWGALGAGSKAGSR